jgi:hypothetical protein
MRGSYHEQIEVDIYMQDFHMTTNTCIQKQMNVLTRWYEERIQQVTPSHGYV